MEAGCLATQKKKDQPRGGKFNRSAVGVNEEVDDGTPEKTEVLPTEIPNRIVRMTRATRGKGGGERANQMLIWEGHSKGEGV